jgi:hypothetical protein
MPMLRGTRDADTPHPRGAARIPDTRERLGLAAGREVTVVVKATEVLLATD